MTNRLFVFVLGFVLAAGALYQPGAAYQPTGELAELYELDRLPRLRPGVECRMFSSYDRTGGNNDGFGGTYSKLREEDGDSVIAEMQGPGCIRRIWFTHSVMDSPGLLSLKREHLRVYLDGRDQPVIDMPLEDILYGKHPRFPSPLAGEALGGFYCYVPIPYRDGCKVVVEGDGVRFYQIQYETFPSADGVKTFEMELKPHEQQELRGAVSVWSSPFFLINGTSPKATSSDSKLKRPGGEAISLNLPDGPAMVRAILLKYDPSELDLADEATLRITWDGADKPAVELPLAYLFGQTPQAAEYQSLLTGKIRGARYCFMPMPYRESAKLTIEGAGDSTAMLTVITEPLDEWRDDLAYFHAEYREELPPTVGQSYTLLKRKGKGHYMGTFLVTDGGEGYHDLPFWLEGDERFTVDGELMIHGTGSEDYFNCGWYAVKGRLEKPGGLPLHGFPVYHQGEPMTRAVAYRWHVTDPVPYEQEIDATIEHGPQNDKQANYSSAVFFYDTAKGRE